MALEIVTLQDGTKQVIHTAPLLGKVNTSIHAPSLQSVQAALHTIKEVARKHNASVQSAIDTLEAFILTR